MPEHAILSRLKIDGVKGCASDLSFTGADLIVGPNRSGKTAILRAAIVGLLGYDPTLGKTPSATMGLASGDRMVIDVEIEGCPDLRGISRTFTANDKGAAQELSTFPAIQGGKNKTEAIINERLRISATLLDLTEFLGMTANAQRQFLFKLCGDRLGINIDDATDLVRDKLADNNAAQCILTTEAGAARKGLAPDDAAGFLAALLDRLKSLATTTNSRLSEAQAAANRITEQKHQHDTNSKPVDICRNENDAAHAELEKIAAEIAEAKQKQKRHTWLRGKIDEAGRNITSLTERAETLEKNILGLTLTRNNLDDLLTKNSAMIDQMHALKAEAVDLLRSVTAIEQGVTAGKCPVCEDVECANDFAAILDAKKAALSAKNAELESVENVIREAFGHTGVSVATLSQQIEKATTQIDAQTQGLADIRERIKADEEQRCRDEEELGVTPASLDISTLESAQVGHRALIEQNTALIKQHEERNRDLVLIEEAVKDVDKLTKELEAIKAVQSAAGPKGALGEILAKAKHSVLSAANAFISEVLPGIEATFDESGALGANVATADAAAPVFVPLATLSHAEQITIFCGLKLSVMLLSDAKLRVLIADDIEAFDRDNRIRFVMACMRLLHSGLVSNVILSGVEGPGEDIPDLNVIRL